VIPSLGGGGAQRVVTTLMRQLPTALFDLHLALVDKSGAFLADVPPHITIHDLKAGKVRRAALPIVRLVRKLAPEVVFSTAGHLNIVIAALRRWLPRQTRIVLREVNVSQLPSAPRAWRLVRHHMRRAVLPSADTIVCQSQFMQRDLCSHLKLPVSKTHVIYNPIDFEWIAARASDASPFPDGTAGPNIVAVGSMHTPKKGFDRAIRSLPALVQRQPGAKLWILGQGRLETKLKALADKLDVGGNTKFPGFQQNPFRWLAKADLFVLPSRHEGTPNALLEAIACGCPVITSEHPGGTREVMELLGQPSRVAASLEDWYPQWFERPHSSVVERAVQHFAVDRITSRYASLLRGARCTSGDGFANTSRAAA
jgi:glycosyltransferase involved in cell wall biosynthesis